MTLTPEQLTLIIGAIVSLLGALTYMMKRYSDTKHLLAEGHAAREKLEAESERAEVTTQGNTIKLITDEVVKRGDQNSELNRQLRDCEVEKAGLKATINELRNMNNAQGERNEMQGKMLRDAAARIEALEALEAHLRAKVTTYELKLSDNLKDE